MLVSTILTENNRIVIKSSETEHADSNIFSETNVLSLHWFFRKKFEAYKVEYWSCSCVSWIVIKPNIHSNRPWCIRIKNWCQKICIVCSQRVWKQWHKISHETVLLPLTLKNLSHYLLLVLTDVKYRLLHTRGDYDYCRVLGTRQLSILEVGEDNSKSKLKKLRKTQSHQYGQTKGFCRGFQVCWVQIWPPFCASFVPS